MTTIAWILLKILSDGKAHQVSLLCQELNTNIAGLNALRLKLPDVIQSNLRQNGAEWQLKYTLSVFQGSDFDTDIGDWKIQVLDSCTSSSALLIEEAKNSSESIHQKVIIANEQTQARGRQGKQWQTVVGHNLSFSFAWFANKEPADLGAVSLVMALACYKALRAYHIPVQIKWPNDLVVGDKKLGGILIERVRGKKRDASYIVVGIGLNYCPSLFLPDYAISISEFVLLQPAELLRCILTEIKEMLITYFSRGFVYLQAEYTKAHRDQDKYVMISVDNKPLYQGIVLDVDNQNGTLIIEEDSSTIRRVVNGESSLRRIKESSLNNGRRRASQILLLDAGNSQLKWSWIVNKQIINTYKTPYNRLEKLQYFCQTHPLIEKIYGSSVVSQSKMQLVVQNLTLPIQWLASEGDTCNIRNHYRNYQEHGADRWFNAIGAKQITPNACVIVSCGTAVTIDALTGDGQYMGGSILPGLNLMQEALATKTAHLNKALGKVYPFSTTTSNAIASGIMDAVVGAILLMHQRFKKFSKAKNVDVILTGGGAKKILSNLPEDFTLHNKVVIVDNLVILGLLKRIEKL